MNKENIWVGIVGIFVLFGFGLSIYFYGFWQSTKALLLSVLIALFIIWLISSIQFNAGLDTPILLSKIGNILPIIATVLGVIGFIISYILILR